MVNGETEGRRLPEQRRLVAQGSGSPAEGSLSRQPLWAPNGRAQEEVGASGGRCHCAWSLRARAWRGARSVAGSPGRGSRGLAGGDLESGRERLLERRGPLLPHTLPGALRVPSCVPS